MLTSMCPLLLVCGAVVSLGGAAAFSITLRSQHMSTVGRQEWIVDNVVAQWTPAETAVVVVDMWNKHWCKTATTRVGEIAVPMNETLSAARKAGIHIVFAPPDVTSFYAKNPARLRTLSLPNATLPPSAPSKPAPPPFPLGTGTDGGCDTPGKMYDAWSSQIDTLAIDGAVDYLIAADLPGKPMVKRTPSATKYQCSPFFHIPKGKHVPLPTKLTGLSYISRLGRSS
jgi:hypothetical protein